MYCAEAHLLGYNTSRFTNCRAYFYLIGRGMGMVVESLLVQVFRHVNTSKLPASPVCRVLRVLVFTVAGVWVDYATRV